MEDTQETIKIFVFGILKSTGRAFHRDECLGCEKDTLPNHLMYSVGGSFPASVRGDGTIVGETHTYPRSILSTFDSIEGYNKDDHDSSFNLYTREIATTENGHEVSYYLFNRSVEGMDLVEDGVWG